MVNRTSVKEFCYICNNTGWILPSNNKIPVEETIGLNPNIRFELPIRESMIKCHCKLVGELIKPKEKYIIDCLK